APNEVRSKVGFPFLGIAVGELAAHLDDEAPEELRQRCRGARAFVPSAGGGWWFSFERVREETICKSLGLSSGLRRAIVSNTRGSSSANSLSSEAELEDRAVLGIGEHIWNTRPSTHAFRSSTRKRRCPPVRT